MISAKRKRNKGSEKFEDFTYKNKGGINSMTKEEIIEILIKKYKHPNYNKLKRKTKLQLIHRLQQIQKNCLENAIIPIPELEIVEEY